MIRRLRIKFICINMAIVTLLLCGIFALVLFFTKTNLERESLGMMQSIASDPLRPGRPGETPEGVRLPYFILELDDEGAVVSAEGGYYDLTDEDFLAALASQASGGDVTGILEDYGLRYCRVSVHGKEYIVFADMSSERNVIGSLVRDCLLIGVLSFAAFLAVSFLLARWAVRPVELAWEKQRQFVADASHELKTPLTVILSNAQLLGEDASDAATRERLTGNILSMSTRIRGLAEDLLELARVDDVPSRPCGEAFDLSRLVSEAVLPFEPLFYERGLGLESDIEPGICVRGDAEGLSRVLGILLDNAQKYSSPGGRALVYLRRAGYRHCLLRVESPGEPLSSRELRDIFKRFYRTDAARSSGGYGLGHAIAKGIVESQRGKLWAEAIQGGNRFCVRLQISRAGKGTAR